MLPENRSFFIRGDDGEEYGPVDLAELREWVRENRAGIGTEVRRDQPDGTWNTWQTYPELIALLAEVAVTTAVPGAPGLALASFWRRILAFGLDLFLAAILSSPLVFLLTVESGIPDLEQRFLLSLMNPDAPVQQDVQTYGILGSLISNAIMLLYFTGFIVAHGKTPAKSLLRVRVVDQFGQKPGLLKAALRTLVMIFSMNLFFIPIAYAFCNPQRRALHDYIAGTYVVEA